MLHTRLQRRSFRASTSSGRRPSLPSLDVPLQARSPQATAGLFALDRAQQVFERLCVGRLVYEDARAYQKRYCFACMYFLAQIAKMNLTARCVGVAVDLEVSTARQSSEFFVLEKCLRQVLGIRVTLETMLLGSGLTDRGIRAGGSACS